MWDTSIIFKLLLKINNHPLGENSLNLVTLFAEAGFFKRKVTARQKLQKLGRLKGNEKYFCRRKRPSFHGV
jgi:hypothetical protein